MTTRPHQAQGGPPLPLLAAVFVLLQLAAVALSTATPHPTDAAAVWFAYARDHGTELRVAAFLQVASAIPLAILAATAYRRLRGLGVTAPGTAIGFAGGLLAAVAISVCGLLGWTEAQLGGSTSPDITRALGELAFATGSAGVVPPLALLLAGIAVPSLLLRFLPRWLAVAGLVLAGVGMLSTFTLLTPALDVTLPIGRFGALVWLLAASALLPVTRRRATSTPDRMATTPA
ncbi:MAG TPA: DUF4386 domain-containing protein [Pseudonocardiaceae bacterium]|jgi:hypothetical protein|nr:DUF4386 domain-containing protein [Pseudonocardiaceae bacterium]